MSKMPRVTARELIKFFEQRGFVKSRQRGSHVIFSGEGFVRPVVIPDHNEVLGHRVVRNNLNIAGISRDEFIDAIQNLRRVKRKG